MVPGVATLGQRQVTMVINKGHFSVLLPTYWEPKVHTYLSSCISSVTEMDVCARAGVILASPGLSM